MAANEKGSNARTGVSGLDDILGGGLSKGNVFLLEGFADVVNRLILLAELDNPLSNRVALRPWARGPDKELSARLASKLMK